MNRPALAVPPSAFSGASGKDVTVGLVDTGVFFQHEHLLGLGEPAFRASVVRTGVRVEIVDDDASDPFGHGTACAALLFALAPGVRLGAIRVTSPSGGTDAERLAFGLEEAVRRGARVVVTPLGTQRPSERLRFAVETLVARGAWIVAPQPTPETLPGALPGVVGVRERAGLDAAFDGTSFVADGRPRAIPGRAKNFSGPSFAAVRVAAALCRAIELHPGALDLPHFKKLMAMR